MGDFTASGGSIDSSTVFQVNSENGDKLLEVSGSGALVAPNIPAGSSDLVLAYNSGSGLITFQTSSIGDISSELGALSSSLSSEINNLENNLNNVSSSLATSLNTVQSTISDVSSSLAQTSSSLASSVSNIQSNLSAVSSSLVATSSSLASTVSNIQTTLTNVSSSLLETSSSLATQVVTNSSAISDVSSSVQDMSGSLSDVSSSFSATSSSLAIRMEVAEDVLANSLVSSSAQIAEALTDQNLNLNSGSLSADTGSFNQVVVNGDVNISGTASINDVSLDTLSITVHSGSTVINQVPSSSFNARFYDYYIQSGSNLRAGSLMTVLDENETRYIDTSTTDIGDTSAFSFSTNISSGNLSLVTTTDSNGWTVKTFIRSL